MKTFFYRCALVALPFAPLPSALAAYNPAIVAADARWIVYADLNALRESTLGKEFIGAVGQAQTAATGGKIGLDIPKLLTTVGSVTAYGSNLSANPDLIDGTLIVQGTPDLRKIAESLLLQGTLAEPKVFGEVTDLPFPAYSIADPSAPEGQQMKLVIAFPPEPIVLASKSKAQLVKARDVFRGSGPSLARGGSPALGRLATNASGAYLFAASVVPSEPIFPQNSPQARTLQLASSGALAFGERGPNTFAHAELLASSEQNADKLMKILQGMAAVLSMAETNDKQLAEFLNSTAVTREKDTVLLRLAYPTERLVQMGQALRAQAEGRPVNRPQVITSGKTVAEWNSSETPARSRPAAEGGQALSWRTIENVALLNGATISLGRAVNGGEAARFEHVEVIPAGGGAPLSFPREFMRQRGPMSQVMFPGRDGVYTLRVGYTDDTNGNGKFAVSVSEPKAPAAPAAPAAPKSR
jgi:hypothetical protein